MNLSRGQQEPSMEEALASIRKIIRGYVPEEIEGRQAKPTFAWLRRAQARRMARPVDEGTSYTRVVGLTSMLDEDCHTAGNRGVLELIRMVEEDGRVVELTAAETDACGKPEATMSATDGGEDQATAEGGMLERLVRDALEPHIKQWLDENLEPLVERVVREEVRRLGRRIEDE